MRSCALPHREGAYHIILIPDSEWPTIRRRAAAPAFAAAAARIRREADAFLAHPLAPPDEPAGYYHDYFCPEHGIQLAFDPARPAAHACPVDGTILTGPRFDAAWRFSANALLSQSALNLALAWRLWGADRYRAACAGILLEYAARYAGYAAAPKTVANPGIVAYTTLDESTWIIPLVWAFDVLGDGLAPAERSAVADQLLAPAGKYLVAHHHGRISNFACWHNAAIGTVGLALGRDDLVQFAIRGPFGFDAQLRDGVLGDGLWFEGSFSYHFFTVAACLALARAALHTPYDLRDRPSLAAMLVAPILCAYPDGTLPATNDCWYFTSLLADCCHGVPPAAALYELGHAWYREPLFGQLLRSAYGVKLDSPVGEEASRTSLRGASVATKQSCPTGGIASGHTPPLAMTSSSGVTSTEAPGPPRDSLEALLYGTDELPAGRLTGQASVHLPDSGYAILRSPPRGRSDATTQRYLLLKHGPHGGVHGHPDKLSISLFAHGCRLSPDLGTPGYGLELYESWYRQTASHNTVTLDGHSQPPATGRIIRFDGEGELHVADAAVAWADDPANGVYAGVEFRRVLLARPAYIFDLFLISCPQARRIDWLFRCAGEWAMKGRRGRSVRPGLVSGDGQGYQHVVATRRRATASDLALTWQAAGARLKLWLAGMPGTELVTGRVPGNPPSEMQTLALVRRQATTAAFAAVWHTYRHRARVTAVEWAERDLLAAGWAGCTVRVGCRREAMIVRLAGGAKPGPASAWQGAGDCWEYILD